MEWLFIVLIPALMLWLIRGRSIKETIELNRAATRFGTLRSRSEKAGGPNGDPYFQDYWITEVFDQKDYWLVCFDDQVPMPQKNLPIHKSLGYPPQKGDRVRLYGDFETVVHGMLLNDTVLFWFPPSKAPIGYNLNPLTAIWPPDTGS